MKKPSELKPQQVKKIFEITAIVTVIVVLLSTTVNNLVIAVIGLVVMTAALVFNIVYYRCPYCGKHLGRDGGDFCQHCGKKF